MAIMALQKVSINAPSHGDSQLGLSSCFERVEHNIYPPMEFQAHAYSLAWYK